MDFLARFDAKFCDVVDVSAVEEYLKGREG